MQNWAINIPSSQGSEALRARMHRHRLIGANEMARKYVAVIVAYLTVKSSATKSSPAKWAKCVTLPKPRQASIYRAN